MSEATVAPRVPATYADLDRIVLGALARPGRAYRAAVAALGAGVALGVACFAYQMREGLGVAGISHPVGWGVYIATFVFWIGIAHSGTFISAVLYLLRARWRLPIHRCAEAMTVIAVMIAGLFPLIHLGRVERFYFILPVPNQRHLWPNMSSPLVWDAMAIGTYLTVSSIFLYVGMLPDLAVARDASTGLRGRAYALLALGWRGASGQYHHQGRAYFHLAVLATVLVVLVASIVSFDFSMSILPGWHTTIFAPYFVAGAVHSGLAMVILLLVPLRRLVGFDALLSRDHFENLAKVMLLTTGIVGYVYVVEPFVAWMSGDPVERAQYVFRAGGPYAPAFWLAVLLNAGAPLSLAWRRARRSLGWLFALSLLVTLGMWLERFVIVVSATAHDFLPANWDLYRPTWVELGILAGSFALFGLLFLLFVRHLPAIAAADLKAALEPGRAADGGAGGIAGPADGGPAALPGAALAVPGLRGVFRRDAEAAAAVRELRAAGLGGAVEVFAPCASPAIAAALGRRPSPLRLWALGGAFAGFGAGLALPISSASIYALTVGAKPHPALPAFLLIAVLGGVLGASLATLAGFAVHGLGRSPGAAPVAAYDPRYGRDRFGVFVRLADSAGGERRAAAAAILARAGAEAIHAGGAG